MKEEKIREIAESLINGNWNFNRPQIKRLSKADYLRLVLTYSILNDENLNLCIHDFIKMF